jgi:WD40 repeat protein/serine/threonine protein kinase
VQEQSIFIEALEREDPAERAAFLDRACAADPALRQRVERLLRRHQQSGPFLEPPATDPAATVEEQPLAERPGTVIGPYKLMEQIGEGGMGLVFVAEQQQPVRRRVALKVIKPGMDTREVIARFEAERQALALMDHPNIARVLDAGATESGRPYFVMELVRGVPITDYCDQNNLTPRERLELFASVCQAVQHAHQKGIIHRDLKPSNVLVTLHDGTPVAKVIDFGVAKAVGGQLTEKTVYTGFMQMIGTPLYMSPEQAEMSGLDVDTRSDIYSLGVLLYELLTGTTPFDKERLRTAAFDEIRRIIREEEPARPSTRISTLGQAAAAVSARRRSDPRRLSQLCRGELDWIVMKALEKDRNRRYETASAFAADVQRYLHDEPVQACPPSAWYRLRKFARRNRAGVLTATSLAVGVVLALGGLASALVVLTASTARINAEKTQTQEALGREKEANDQLLRARADAVAEAYRALLGETQALRLARPAGWRDKALGNLRRLAAMDMPKRDFAELRSEAVACLAEADAREALHLEGHTEVLYGLDFSPDGKALASAGYDGQVIVWDLAEGNVVRQVTDPAASDKGFWTSAAPLPVVRFRPGGGYLAYTTWGRRVEFLGWGEHPAALPALEGPAQPRDLAFDRKGDLLAVSWGDGQVGVYDAGTGEARRLIAAEPPGAEFYMPVALSPGGNLLATRGAGETVQLYTVAAEGEPRGLRGHHTARIRSLAFSPDGKRLASASDDHTVKLWDVKSGKELLPLQGHTSKVVAVAFSPDGELVASCGDDETVRLWEVETGRPLLVLRPGMSPEAVAFSPDGRRLATGFRAVVVYDLGARPGRHLAGHGFWTTGLAFHPRRPLLASASRSSDVTLRDVATGREVRRWDQLPGPVGNLVFSPDGRLLAAAPFARFNMFYWPNRDVCLLEADTGKVRRRFAGNFTAAVAFDPEGRRLALGDQGGAVTVCDVASGETVGRWQAAKGWISDVAFCEGGTRLLVGEVGGALRLCDAADGRTLRRATLPHGLWRFALDRGGRHVAAADVGGTVRVLTLPDLRVVATLAVPTEPAMTGLAFSDDGRWLVVGGIDRRVTVYDARTFRKVLWLPPQTSHVFEVASQPGGPGLAVGGAEELLTVWDLSRVESALAAVGLGWEALPDELDRAPPAPPTAPVTRIRAFNQASTQSLIWFLEQVLETAPDQPDMATELAWVLVAGEKKFRDPARALPLARRAVELAPDEPVCRNTLGVVYYRLGRWDEAVEALQAAARANRDGPTAYDLFFLAMTYHRTGQAEKARECYDQAMGWWRARPGLEPHEVTELRAIRAEADAVLAGKGD